jgi:hypothetical protein
MITTIAAFFPLFKPAFGRGRECLSRQNLLCNDIILKISIALEGIRCGQKALDCGSGSKKQFLPHYSCFDVSTHGLQVSAVVERPLL